MSYKVMLVDDDSLVRMGLRHSVDWAAKGLELAGEAADGGEALALMDTLRPDIVFSDMYMPKFDGIKFIEQALARYPDTIFVVLSCHNDFQYIKESLRLGVYDYLLKSSIVNSDELDRVLDNIVRLLDEKRNQPAPVENAANPQDRAAPSPQHELKGMLAAYLRGQTELEVSLAQQLTLHGANPLGGPLYLVGVDFDNYASMLAVFRDAPLLDYAIENILNEIIGEHGSGIVIPAKNHVFYALMNVVTKNTFITPDDKVLSICEWIRINIKNNLKSTCSLYVPASVDFSSLPETYDVLSDEIEKRHPHNFDTIVDLRGFAPEEAADDGPRADPVDACIEHILLHYREKISLDDLADLTGMSKFHLCKKFKDRTNSSIVNYMLQVRIDKAKELLVRNRNKVFVVANLVGFNDVSYFNRTFKKLTGLSPTEYVERNSSILTASDETPG